MKGWYGNKYGHSLASRGIRSMVKKPKMETDVDVFGFLYEIILKKDLDTFDFEFSGHTKNEREEIWKDLQENPDSYMEYAPYRSNKAIYDVADKYYNTLVLWIMTGEEISKNEAKYYVNKFMNELEEEI